MAIELFGWAIKPEINIGYIAAVVGVILSALIFLKGYRLTRRTEEIKIVSDLMNKIDNAYGMRYLFYLKNPHPKDDSRGIQIQWFNEHLRYLIELQMNIRYLTVLVRYKDIKANHLFNHCRGHVNTYLDYLENYYTIVEKEYPEFLKKELSPAFHAEIPYLRQVWKHEKLSRWQKILRSITKPNSRAKI